MRRLTNNLLVPVAMRLLIWQAEKRKRPFIGSINVVNRCNLHCAGCYWTRTEREQDRAELSIDEVVAVPFRAIGEDADASAAVLTKAICAVTGQRPAATCGADAGRMLGAPAQP